MNFPKALIDGGTFANSCGAARSDLGGGAVTAIFFGLATALTAIFFGLATANDSFAVGTCICFGRATCANCFGRAAAIDSHFSGTIMLQLVVQLSAAYFALLAPMGLLDVAVASNVLSPELEDANWNYFIAGGVMNRTYMNF